MRTRTATALIAGLVAATTLLSGCGSTGADPSSPPTSASGDSHVMSDGSTMSGSMKGMDMGHDGSSLPPLKGGAGDAKAPSETASMICSTEIRKAVARNLDRDTVPAGLHAWSGRLFTCAYRLGGGDLVLSVKDLDQADAGRAYFDRLVKRLPGATKVGGMANFGFPAYESPHGDVVFIKDHKTLWVDASRLSGSDLPAGSSRQDVAYGVAAAVIACWTE